MDELWIEFEEKSSYKFPSDGRRFPVMFKLSCQSCFENYIIRHHSPEVLCEITDLPRIETLVVVSLAEKEKARTIMERDLQGWPVKPEGIRWLIDYAIKEMWELFECMPPDHNSMILNFRVRGRHVHADYEEDDKKIVSMVPADESSSIESSLEKKKKKIMDCSICLDEILIGAEGLPCCHVFHEDCIKKWLKTSCYCPVCRYHLPVVNRLLTLFDKVL